MTRLIFDENERMQIVSNLYIFLLKSDNGEEEEIYELYKIFGF